MRDSAPCLAHSNVSRPAVAHLHSPVHPSAHAARPKQCDCHAFALCSNARDQRRDAHRGCDAQVAVCVPTAAPAPHPTLPQAPHMPTIMARHLFHMVRSFVSYGSLSCFKRPTRPPSQSHPMDRSSTSELLRAEILASACRGPRGPPFLTPTRLPSQVP